ncbi:hypothetical protein GCM10023142_35710 [Anaerocolumna aminovalerica]|uniref:hypothetical protein n=1 Tax=Anaerocolumna aminovalerica TaxID=1527 RepID=UPI000B88D2BA|nr:hypothetical protein [Anaerocolumna aminovalerica]MBU5332395.1 hypothetical protein [Anaerocolumna aminovalerica]
MSFLISCFYCTGIENVPDELTSGEIYTGNGIQYQFVEKFEHNGKFEEFNQLHFNKEDLINNGIIK